MKNPLLFRRVGRVALVFLLPTLAHAELRPGFEALPIETMVAARLDNSPAALAPYREHTRLGEVLLSEKMAADFRVALNTALEETETGQRWAEKLESFGLEPDDLFDLIQGQFASALVNQPVDETWKMPTVLAWADGDSEVINKVYESILRAIEESDDHERSDEEIGDFTISRVRIRSTGSSFLLAKLENRIHFAIGYPQNGAVQDDDDNLAHEAAEFNLLGSFLTAAKGEGGGFLETIYRDPAIAAHALGPKARFEILGSVPRLIANTTPASRVYHAPLGVDRLGHFGVWSRIEGKRETFKAVLGIARPLAGIAKLFAMDPVPVDPPNWVPSDVMSYAEIAFDLPYLFKVSKEIASSMTTPEVVNAELDQADRQLQENLQVDIAGLLASFGKRIFYFDYPPKEATVDLGNNQQMTIPAPEQVVAIDFSRPDILESAFELSGAILNNPNSMVEAIDELGFRGLRFTTPNDQRSLAYGVGKVLYTVGDGIDTKAFSLLRQPPAEADTLANESRFREFLQRESPTPGLLLQYVDGRRAFSSVIPAFKTLASVITPGAPIGIAGPPISISGDGNPQSFLSPFLELIPEEEVLETLVHYIYARTVLEETGLVIEVYSELE